MNPKHYYNLLKMINNNDSIESIINYSARHNIKADDFQDANGIGLEIFEGTELEKWEQILAVCTV
jgi:hypothetical protein